MPDRSARSRKLAATVLVLCGAVTALTGCQPAAGPQPKAEVSRAPFLVDQDFFDPDVIDADGVYIAATSNSYSENIQTATSTDLAVSSACSWSIY